MAHARINIITVLICLITSYAGAASVYDVNADTPYVRRTVLEKYEGNWQYHDDSITFHLKLKLYPKTYSPYEKSYSDYMFGWYSFEKKSGDSVIAEETLSRYDPLNNPMQVFFEKGNDPGYDAIHLFPSMIANDRGNSDISLMFKRMPKNNGPALNMIAVLSNLSNTSLTALFKPGDNIGFNHEMDYMVIYWRRIPFPSEMKLTKVVLRN